MPEITDISKPGDTLVGQLEKWNAISSSEKAALDYIFVQIGLNDTDETSETFRTQYKSLVEQIRKDSPDAELVLGTMLPCKKRLEVLYKENWQVNYERWKSANEDIKNGYYDCDRIAYLHTDALGLDDNLRSEYNHGDHIHENIAGAKIIVYSWYLAAFGDSDEKTSYVRMQYDDRYDVSGKTVELVDAGESVVAVEGNYLRVTGTGKAKVRIDGTLYEITAEKAKVKAECDALTERCEKEAAICSS